MNENNEEEKHDRKPCPSCGLPVPVNSLECPECGELIVPEAFEI